jgi:GTP-binding protein YchF
MNIQVGIVGLPNVGKSTLFKALTKKQVEAANYPFTTIEPNVGVVAVPDTRLDQLVKVSKSKKVVPTIVEFVDIAGLVKGAAKGEGLGNKFLSHIREVAAVAHVVRAFEGEVTHVHGKVDPANDVSVIEAELALADLETVSKRLSIVSRTAKAGVSKEAALEASALSKVKEALEKGQAARSVALSEAEFDVVRKMTLLTSKPMLYVVNVSEEQFKDPTARAAAIAALKLPAGTQAVAVSAKIESELAELSEEDKATFLKELGLERSGLDDLIKSAYEVLGLITFFTSGEQESRAWTVRRGAKAPEAAGQIHTDFERGFIKAETVFWKDLVEQAGWAQAREHAKVRTEGKEYLVKDGDVMLFKFNV